MKTFCIFILLGTMLLIAGPSAHAQTKEVVIRLGAHCDHFEQCETGKTRLEKELMFAKGVKDIKIDSNTKTVTVQFNAKKTNEQKIREAISKAGYDADDVKADPKGYARLDECCWKKE
jgi:periplasmic mercuric ion binding protein